MPDTTTEIFDIVEMNQFESFKDELPELHRIAENHNLSHVPVRNILLYGDLIFNINKVCKEEAVDLIVMGTKGATGLKETFLGSTTGSVMSNTTVPVLGIPAEAEFRAVRNIGFTTQYKDKDNDAIREAIIIAKKYDARIHCLYIKSNEDPIDIEERIAEWKMFYKEDNIEFHNFIDDDKEQAILEFIEDHFIDLLIMRTHKRGFFEGLFHRSLTKKMAYHTNVPLLVFH